MSDRVSVVMPAYNAERTIGAAMESAPEQTYSNFELIIVDDASQDETVDVVRTFDDERIRLVLQESNCGEGATRDAAISHSSGEWVAFLDADDAWEDNRLEQMLELEPHVTNKFILVDNLMQCYEKDGEMIPWKPLWSGDSALMSNPVLTLCEYLMLPRFIVAPLFPRKAIVSIGLKHSDLKFSADSEFIIRLLKLADLKIKVFPKPMYLYRLTPGSASSIKDRDLITRDMLLQLETDLDFTEGETEAIDFRKSLLEKRNEYMRMLNAFREKRYLLAISLCILKPGHFREFARRLPVSLRYRLELLLTGGRGR